MHIIHNIAFEIAINHDDGLVSWEQYYVDFFQDKLLPRVESICDDWDRKYPNTKCAIDSIDINVEVDDLNLETLQKEIIQQISQQLINIQSDGTSSDGKLIAKITPEASTFDALLSYLSDGILPAYVPVKTFKEWLGNRSEFTSAEKTKLNIVFASSSDAIERMLSLLRNNYTAFSVLIETKQQFTTQYITLEANFFQQFIKAICKGFQLHYDDAVASIWHKTLGVSTSITQFSKTFLQLLQPKVQSEGKRITKSNERFLSIALLKAIVQYEAGKSITIDSSKIATLVKETSNNKQDTIKDVLKQQKDSKPLTKNSKETAQHDLIDSDAENEVETKVEVEGEIENKVAIEVESEIKANNRQTKNQSEKEQSEENDQIEIEDYSTVNELEKEQSKEFLSEENYQAEAAAEFENENEAEVENEVENQIHINESEITQFKEDKTENSPTEKNQAAKHQTNEKEVENASTKNANVHGKTADPIKNTTANKTKSILAKAKTTKIPKDIALTTEKSGLILLHPFLTTFLKGADLVTENNEINDIDKACVLLHYLATENEDVTDVELTLEKIMLGIPLETICNYQMPLTTEDKALCDELLNAVLTHWVVLKKSTINTLRDMFIKRDGHITITEESIKLKIERSAQDILLEKVPWNISLFRLKWMEKMVHIEW